MVKKQRSVGGVQLNESGEEKEICGLPIRDKLATLTVDIYDYHAKQTKCWAEAVM